MSWFYNTTLALMLQSNSRIGQMIAQGEHLKPDYMSYSGLTGPFAQFFLFLIYHIGGFVHSYGLAIILTAIVVRLLLLPLTRKQITGMRSMQQLQPVMKEIQRHYPEKQDQSAKTMELYQRYKINPFSGCFPMLIQLPILFGVYRALYDPFFAGKTFLNIQLLFPVNVTSGRSFGIGPALQDIIDVTIAENNLFSQLWQVPDSIPWMGGWFFYLPAIGLVVLYIASSFFMQRIIRKVNQPDEGFQEEFREMMQPKKKRKDEPNKPQEPDMAAQMQKQMKFMNLLIILFAFIFSSGALLYFIVQNLLMATEYMLIPKTAGGPQLDPKDLRDFIRTPPVPTGAKNPQVQKALDKQAAKRKSKEGTVEDAEIESQEDGTQEGESPALRRPRKKRRKR